MISVILPAYNAEKTIERAISSVLNQKEVDLELLVINDGSTDKTGEICEKIRECDNRVKVFHIENSGVSFARNYGLSQAKGKYIGFIDSDDWIEANMYKVLLQLLQKKTAQLAVCSFINDVESQNESKEINSFAKNTGTISGKEMYKCVFCSKKIGGYLWNKLFIKQYITETLNIKYAQCEDFIFVLNYLKNIKKIAYTDEILYHYVHTSLIITSAYTKRFISLMPAYEEILKIYQENAIEYVPDIRKSVLKIYLNFRARYRIEEDKDKQLRENIKNGIKKHLLIVMSNPMIKVTEKFNILLTYVFPKTVFRIKNKILLNQRKKGIW